MYGRSLAIIMVPAVFGTLSVTTVCLRCFVRIKIVKQFGWDDHIMIIAAISNLGFALCGIIGGVYGIGRKLEYFEDRPDDFQKAMLCWWFGQIFYTLAATAMRLSISITLLRFTSSRVHVAFLYGIMVVSTVAGTALLFFTIFQCSPISYYWRRLEIQGECHDSIEVNLIYFYSGMDAICDIAIGFLPAVLIRKLTINRRTKAGIAVLLGLGCVAISGVIARIPFVHLMTKSEFLYQTTWMAICSDFETGIGIIAGSLMVMRPAFSFFTNSRRSTRGHMVIKSLSFISSKVLTTSSV
ncbi:hypothetical protein BDV26DRAFT_252203 [Aspergillus bertholletiae]|uniref:Rhodopsin domain-containing protein n=1 Tax=Aspergillus bertholletiae TaxID=1226010 RepID=A0A5N7BMU1_9EURO|nr:hypothetical protein BDV26DRAFT_252203 [Aspergillus bertholletiae]